MITGADAAAVAGSVVTTSATARLARIDADVLELRLSGSTNVNCNRKKEKAEAGVTGLCDSRCYVMLSGTGHKYNDNAVEL